MRPLTHRRALGFTIVWGLLLGVCVAARAQATTPLGELMLYGMRLKGASAESFITAALKAGAAPLAQRSDEPPSFDTRAAGVPGLQRLTVVSDATGLVSAQFVIKPYGQENEALRQLLVSKYGLAPETVTEWFSEGREGWLSAQELVGAKLATEIIADPSDVIDVAKIKDMIGIDVSGDTVTIRAATTHYDVAQSDAVQKAIPALAHLASMIGDPAVRHRGTIGGSLANNDPAADYPAAVLAVAFIVTSVIMIWVVPSFKSVFESFGAELPLPTLMVIWMSDRFVEYWYLLFGSLTLGGVLFVRTWKHSPALQAATDRLLLRLPVFGEVVRKAVIARWTRTLSTMFAAGVPLVESLDSVGGASGNAVYLDATQRIGAAVRSGTSLTIAMQQTQVFPSMVTQMVAIGEESGALDQMLRKVAEFYEDEVDAAVASLASLMEPVIMVFLGGLIGGLVIAMYLPIFKLGSVV
jgi:hypothetical protein